MVLPVTVLNAGALSLMHRFLIFVKNFQDENNSQKVNTEMQKGPK